MVQGHVASDHGWLVILSRPGRSGEDEPGVEAIGGCVHKRRALNTRLSSCTSAGTFACPAGPYRKCIRETVTRNEPKWYLYQFKKSVPSRSSRFEPKISLISFSWGSGPPLTFEKIILGKKKSSSEKRIHLASSLNIWQLLSRLARWFPLHIWKYHLANKNHLASLLNIC